MKFSFTFLLFLMLGASLFGKTFNLQMGDSIQEALDKSKKNDTIIINEGTYETEATLTMINKKGITITGKGVVDIFCKSYIKVIIFKNCEDITIQNLHMVHAMGAPSVGCGEDAGLIYFIDCDNVVVKNCELNGCGTVGVDSYNTKNITIEGCYIHSNNMAAIIIKMSLDMPELVQIKNNRIINNYKPIKYLYLELYSDYNNLKELKMENNTIYPGSEKGLYN